MGLPKESIIFIDPHDIMSRLPGYSDKLKGDALQRYNKNGTIISNKVLDMFIESIKSTLNQPIKVEKTKHDLIYI